MRLLVLGGSRFVGRHFVEAALAAGHEVTVFNRGLSGTLPKGAELVVGDRRADLARLAGRHWDAVVDTCGYLPAEVAQSATALADAVDRYLFVSSISVYADLSVPNDEAGALLPVPAGTFETVPAEFYGGLKVGCEQAVRSVLGDERSLIVRPGLVVGPLDPTGRYSWWPARLAGARQGETLLCPGEPDRPLQWIDVRDLADFMLRALGLRLKGEFNVATPPRSRVWGDLIDACEAAAGISVYRHWLRDEVLLARGVAPWTDLPLWLPEAGSHAGMLLTATSHAQSFGLNCRSALQTAVDTLAWWQSLEPKAQAFKTTGLSLEREAALLSA